MKLLSKLMNMRVRCSQGAYLLSRVPSHQKQMRERDPVVPRVVYVHIIIVREQTELRGHKENLDELDNEFIRETSLRLPFLDRIHEEESQFATHLLLRERHHRAGVAFCQYRMILPANMYILPIYKIRHSIYFQRNS